MEAYIIVLKGTYSLAYLTVVSLEKKLHFHSEASDLSRKDFSQIL